MPRPRAGSTPSGRLAASRDPPPHAAHRIVEVVHHAFLQRDDRIIGDVDRLGTVPRAALGDVAVPDPGRLLEVARARRDVEGMHLQAGDADEEAGAGEAVLLLVIAQHVADVLTEEALDALAELLYPVDVRLLDAQRSVRRVGRTRPEG